MISAGRLKCFHISSESNSTPFALKANANFDKKVVAKKADEDTKATIEDEVCETGKEREVVIFEHVYLKGDGDGEVLSTATMVEELIPWDSFFKRFRHEGKKEVQYSKTLFKQWMKRNFPA